MSEADRRGHGTAIPTMFIGLGGIGSRIVDRIAGRASRLPRWEDELRPLTSFLSIDSNETDQHLLRHVPASNRLNIGDFDEAKAIEAFRRSQGSQLVQWLDRAYEPRHGRTVGAGQIRLRSRLGFFVHSSEIRRRLRELVLDTLRPGITCRQSRPAKYNVYLYCTLAGGTGSGSFLSAAYLVDALVREQGWQPRVVGNFLLSTLILDSLAPELHPQIHANTYAALKELEHLTKLDYKQVKDEGRLSEEFVYCHDENGSTIAPVTVRPCFMSFLFDRPPHLSLPDAVAAIADAAFLQAFSPIMDSLVAEFDNYEKEMIELTHFPGGDSKNFGQGYARNFGSFGAAALVLPGHDLLEYCVRRFAAHTIRGYVTFGLSTVYTVDRRALPELAVDYADPGFRALTEKGRGHAIQRAFVQSVRELARERSGVFWHRLVASIGEERGNAPDDQQEVSLGEPAILLVARRLAAALRESFNRISIEERALVFHQEEVNQYLDEVSRLYNDLRTARAIAEDGARGLELAAAEGEALADLHFDPIAERYLVACLLERCEGHWLPEAQEKLDAAQADGVDNPQVRERLEEEFFELLHEAAKKRFLSTPEQPFLQARDEAQQYFRQVASAMRRTFEAEMRLRQLRAFHEYLTVRAHQYARQAAALDDLAQGLEREAEDLRRGASGAMPAFALRVEIFETLEEPRQRIWDRVYRALFLDDESAPDFEPELLASTLGAALVRFPGSTPREETVADVRRSLITLGRDRMRSAIFGEGDRPGIDVVRGLELEARLMLAPLKQPEEDVTAAEIDQYFEKKFKALAQVAGIFARIDAGNLDRLDDGVMVNRTRQLIFGFGDTSSSKASEYFVNRLQAVLGARQVRVATGDDPHRIIVHDAELAIPLYYFEPVTREIESSYLQLKSEGWRSYPFHTDFHWEESLPNLNPRRPEITAGPSLKAFAQALLSGAISYRREAGGWQIHPSGESETVLGSSLAGALYRLGEVLRSGSVLGGSLQPSQSEGQADTERRQAVLQELEALLFDIKLRNHRSDSTRENLLDLPLLRTLIHEVRPA